MCHFHTKALFHAGPSLKKHLVLGEFYVGLYLLKAQSFTGLVNNANIGYVIDRHDSICSISLFLKDIWHARLGHLPITKLQ